MFVVIRVALLLSASVVVATAQEQERKLMDRLLKPDMALQNSAQTRQFHAGGSTPTKVARTKTFHFSQRARTKSYTGVRSFHTQDFQTRTSPDQQRISTIAPRPAVEAGSRYTTAEYGGVRAAPEGEKSARSSEFSGSTRSFLVRGKSQKALSAQDRPLTLEEVRELLNKNK